MPLTGRVFDISRGCVDDGPGIRTVVFMKGCAVDCPWCHNPEGKSGKRAVAIDAARCIECGRCRDACPRTPVKRGRAHPTREGCIACGACAETCPTGARRSVGRDYEPTDLVRELLVDVDFFRGTGGGVTFSGGEPMLQADFVLECARELRGRGVHVAVETAGFFAESTALRVIGAFDGLLFDLKHVDEGRVRETIGGDARRALGNLETLLRGGAAVELRMTVIPGFNDGAEDRSAIATWLRGLMPVPSLRLYPFHRMATAKASLFAEPYPFAGVKPASPSELVEIARAFAREGIDAEV